MTTIELNAPVSSIMSSNVQCIKATDKLQLAKDLFEQEAIHHLPVIDEEETLVGILSELDLMYALRPIHIDSQEQYQNRIRLKNYTVAELMTKEVISIQPDDTIRTALEVFEVNLFHALPVVSEDKVVGIITTHDLISLLLHGTQEKYLS